MNDLFSQTDTASFEVFKKLPGVAAITRCGFITDGLMYSALGEDVTEPVMVRRSGWRGTQNVAQGSKREVKQEADSPTEADTIKAFGIREVSNVMVTDTAQLDPRATGLRVSYGISFGDLAAAPVAFAAAKEKSGEKDFTLPMRYRESLARFIVRAKSSEGLEEVARRYARNILNARAGWRNRVYAKRIKVRVSDALSHELLVEQDALALSLEHFEDYKEAEIKLGKLIAEGLRSETGLVLRVEMDFDFGANEAAEVYPSQNYLPNKPRDFARSLYYVGEAPEETGVSDSMRLEGVRTLGQAALRSTKISNALRTIDTWYPAFADVQRPIAVEPNGANLDRQVFFREGASSAFKLATRLNVLDPNAPEGMFMIAVIMRGGVLSGSKEESGTSGD